MGFRPIGSRKVKIKGQSVADLPVHIVPPDTHFTVLGTSSDPHLIQAQTETMQAVPALPSTIKDVRRSAQSGDLDRRRRGIPNGVPLLHAPESEDDGTSMLPYYYEYLMEPTDGENKKSVKLVPLDYDPGENTDVAVRNKYKSALDQAKSFEQFGKRILKIKMKTLAALGEEAQNTWH